MNESAYAVALWGAIMLAVAEVWRTVDSVREANVEERKREGRRWFSVERRNLVLLSKIALPAYSAVLLLWAMVLQW